jgi:heptosyltransferase I
MAQPLNLLFKTPPRSLCILRLSAIGDITHTLPTLRTIQQAWPDTKISWIIGKTEYQLINDIPNVEFIIFDKSKRWRAHVDVANQLKGRQFDLLLHMQMSMRSSLLAMRINTPVKLGFDKARAKDLQWLFTNYKIAARANEHVVDSFKGFSDAVGISDYQLRWDIPIPDSAREYAKQQIPDSKPYAVISPCSSMPYRNWLTDRYAVIADYILTRGYQVVLTGGPSEYEKRVGEQIASQMQNTAINLIGKSDLKQLLAVLAEAKFVVSPDAGPAHMATAVNTPVIGLYACTNPDRARPYLSADTTVNRYPDAVRQKFATDVSEQPWGVRVRDEFAMKLISVEDVTSMINKIIS